MYFDNLVYIKILLHAIKHNRNKTRARMDQFSDDNLLYFSKLITELAYKKLPVIRNLIFIPQSLARN